MELDVTIAGFRMRVTYAAPAMSSSHIESLIRAFDELRAGVQLNRARFVSLSPGVFDYRVWHADGRVWKQVITFSGQPDSDPLLTFDVDPPWRLSEFAAMRSWRLSCINAVNLLQASQLRIDPA